MIVEADGPSGFRFDGWNWRGGDGEDKTLALGDYLPLLGYFVMLHWSSSCMGVIFVFDFVFVTSYIRFWGWKHSWNITKWGLEVQMGLNSTFGSNCYPTFLSIDSVFHNFEFEVNSRSYGWNEVGWRGAMTWEKFFPLHLYFYWS